jgi:peptidoglycan/xylan/chitin deacetylase (PgdA/CDA1 family)
MSLFIPMYHNVTRIRTNDIFTIEERLFKEHLHWLKLTRHHPVSIAQIIDWLDGRHSLPPRAYIITFDDGYLDNLELALPMLQDYRATACIFVTVNWCEVGKPLSTNRNYPMLSWSNLRQLADAGIEIGAHTLSHPFLTDLEPKTAWEEIYSAKLEIEDHLGREVSAFSYPNSRHNQAIRDMVRQAGYRLAFGGSNGLNRKSTDRYNLCRPSVYNVCNRAEFVLSICTGVHARERYWKWRSDRKHKLHSQSRKK